MVPPDGATDVPRNARLGRALRARRPSTWARTWCWSIPTAASSCWTRPGTRPSSFSPSTPSSSALTANSSLRDPLAGAARPERRRAGAGRQGAFHDRRGVRHARRPRSQASTGLSWDLERKTNDCIDELVERFVFDVDLGAASDDGGTSGLTLMLFQTRGAPGPAMPTPIPARAWPQRRRRGRR